MYNLTTRMSGELYDYKYDDPEIYVERMHQSTPVLQTALGWLAFYYIIIKPFKIFEPSKESIHAYDETGLQCRYTMLFKTWREYENIQ